MGSSHCAENACLIEKLLSDNSSILNTTIQHVLEDMDAQFFEQLAVEARRQNKMDRFEEILRIHLEFSGEQYPHHLDLALALIDAHKANTLASYIEAHHEDLTHDLTHTLLLVAEDNINQTATLNIGLALLEISKILIGQFGYQDLLPHWALILSGYYLSHGDNDNAAQVITDIRQQCIELPTTIKQGLLVNEGLVYFRQGQYQKAIEFYEQHAPQFDDQVLWLQAQSNLAICYSEIGHFSTALALLHKLAETCQLPDHAVELSRIHGNLSNLYGRLGLIAEEKHFLEQSIAAAKAQTNYHFDWSTLLVSYVNFAMLYLRQDDIPQAEHWFEEFKAAAQQTDVESQLLTYARVQAHLQYKKGNHAQALRVIANTKAQFKDRMDMDYLAFLGVAGTVEYRTGHYAEAEATLQELLQRAQTNQHNEFLHTTYGYLGLCAAKTQGMAKAHEYFTAMFRQDAQLRQQISDTAQQFTYSGDKERLHQDIVRLVVQVNDPLRLFNLLQQVKSQALGYQSGIQADFVSIQHALPAKTALLEYYLQGDQHFCLLVSAQYSEPIHFPLPDAGNDRLQAMHAQYLKALSVAKYVKTHNPFDLSGASAALLEPLLARLTGHDTLVIAASGYAHQLPFELFPLGESFMLEQFAITYVPVGGMFQTCQQHRIPAQSSLVIANSHAQDKTNIQEQFLSEATQVAQQLAVEPLLQHPDSASHLLQSVQHRIIHITSHGTFNPAKPTQSGIILKQDGMDVLVAADVWVSSLVGAELVFLSGCDTGKVSLLPNDEIFGPLGLFLTRNVGSLILSHWPVQTQDTTPIAIVTDFYRNWLEEGMSKAKALQQAILQQRNSPNPYFWGGFFLSGAS